MHLFRRVLLCLVLQFGVMIGAPMRPEEIRELLYSMNRPKIVRNIPDESAKGEKLDK